MEGYVYILVNSSLPDLVKVGYTTKSPAERANELSSTGVPNKFIVAYSIFVSDCVEVERQIHDLLKEYRHNQGREFFEIDSTTAIDKLLLLGESWKSSSSTSSGNLVAKAATIYMAKIANYSEMYRVGLIRGSADFLKTDEFRSSLNELYAHYDPDMILGDMNIIKSEEFEDIDEVTFKQMNTHLDNLLQSENRGSKNNLISKKHDERTLYFGMFNRVGMFDRDFSLQFFEKISQSLKPFVTAAKSKSLKEKSDKLINEKLRKIQTIKKMGL
jgi:hypothetical protein